MSASRIASEEAAAMNRTAFGSRLDDHVTSLSRAGEAVRGEHHTFATGEELRPAMRRLAGFVIERGDLRDLAAGRCNAEQRTVGARRKDDGAVLAPRAAAGLEDVRQWRDRAAAQRDRQQSTAGKEANRASVRRKERRVGIFSAGEWSCRQLIESAEVQLPTA